MRPTSRLESWVIRVSLALCALILVSLLGAWGHSVMATARLDAALQRCARASAPTTWDELLARYPHDKESVAARSNLLASIDEINALPPPSKEAMERLPVLGYAETPDLGKPAPPEMLDAIEAQLRISLPALTSLTAAVASRPRILWIAPHPDEWDTAPVAGIREATRLFSLAAMLHAERGEADAALRAASDAWEVAQGTHEGGVVLHELARFACEHLAIESLAYVLARTDPSAHELTALARRLARSAEMKGALHGEIVTTMAYRRGLSDDSAWMRMTASYEADFLLRLLHIWNLPWNDFRAECLQAYQSVPVIYRIGFLCHEYVYANTKAHELKSIGTRDCGLIAIAIEMYARDHSRLPDSLNSLAPDYMDTVPVEPFYGKPFTYRNHGRTGSLSFRIPSSSSSFVLPLATPKQAQALTDIGGAVRKGDRSR